MAPLLHLITLVTLFFGTTAALERLPLGSRYRQVLVVLAILLTLAVTFAVYPSDPRDWSADKLVLYLAEPRLELLAVLGNLLTGSLMLGLFTLGIYWANRSR